MRCNKLYWSKLRFNIGCLLFILGTLVFQIPCVQCIETIYGLEGDNLTLVCPFSPPIDNGRTTWRGPPSNTIFFHNEEKNPMYSKRERLSVIKNKISRAYDLIISNLNRQEDMGIYSCSVNTNPNQQQLFNLKFYDLPIITVFEAYERQVVNEMSPFGLMCIVNSSTSTNTSIKNKSTSEVISDGVFTDTLNFTETSAMCYQTAEYICTATNIAGSIESSPVQIFVNCGPRPLKRIYLHKLNATLGSSIDLSVNVTSYPLPKSEWAFISTTKKDLPSSFLATNISLNITTGSYQLRKTSIAEDDFGLYTLRLANQFGISTAYFYVLKEDNISFAKTRSGNYVMHDIKKMEEHQYQTITSDHNIRS